MPGGKPAVDHVTLTVRDSVGVRSVTSTSPTAVSLAVNVRVVFSDKSPTLVIVAETCTGDPASTLAGALTPLTVTSGVARLVNRPALMVAGTMSACDS